MEDREKREKTYTFSECIFVEHFDINTYKYTHGIPICVYLHWHIHVHLFECKHTAWYICI